MTSELVSQSATELAAHLRSGALSSVEVVTAHLDRIDAINGEVNAIVSRRDRQAVLDDAARADATDPQGRPLHGLPVAVKDLQNVAGLPTRAGSVVTPDVPAASDGIVGRRLRAAGAVIVGKTNVPEFGTGSHTFNEVFGVTRNPWDLSRSAGGSSGGAAAALASRMVPIADGSDLGGSLRNPAGFCNVVGFRPTIGLVPSAAERSTHLIRLGVEGPMGRSVADTALVLSALAGPDARDPLSHLAAARDVADPNLEAADLQGVRIAWGGDLGLFTAERAVLDACRAALGTAAAMGAEVSDTHPDLTNAMHVFRVLRGLSYRDLGIQLGADAVTLLKATVRENIAHGQTLTVDDVLTAERERAQLHVAMSDFFANFDLLALPTAQVVPFPTELEYPHEIEGVVMNDYLEWMTTCCVITPTGCPAISIPAGFSPDGLPIGLQLVGPIGSDRRLLELAAAFETALPHYHDVPPLTYR